MNDLFICESCNLIIDCTETHTYTEHHGPTMNERLRATDCCLAGYKELDEQGIVDCLGEIINKLQPEYTPYSERKTVRENLNKIQIVLEGIFQL